MKDFEKVKLPDDLAEYTGHVMYPDEFTSKWDEEGRDKYILERLIDSFFF